MTGHTIEELAEDDAEIARSSNVIDLAGVDRESLRHERHVRDEQDAAILEAMSYVSDSCITDAVDNKVEAVSVQYDFYYLKYFRGLSLTQQKRVLKRDQRDLAAIEALFAKRRYNPTFLDNAFRIAKWVFYELSQERKYGDKDISLYTIFCHYAGIGKYVYIDVVKKATRAKH